MHNLARICYLISSTKHTRFSLSAGTSKKNFHLLKMKQMKTQLEIQETVLSNALEKDVPYNHYFNER